MTSVARIIACALLVAAPAFSFAAPATSSKAEKTISVEFRGSLRDALKQIAQKGGLNLVVTGDLSQDAEVYLKGVTAQEALNTVAAAYNLRIAQSGSIWTLRPMTPEELKGAEAGAQQGARPAGPPPSGAQLPPVPPVPPAPPAEAAPNVQITPEMSEEEIEAAMREADAFAERTEEQAQQMAQQAEEQADRIREMASARTEEARERAEQIRARAEEARERAREARERAREARQQAREIERDAREAIREATRHIDRIPAVGAGAVEVKEGEVVQDAVAYGGPLRIFGHVQGDAVALGGNVTLGPKAWVEGDVVAVGGSVERADGAVVDGEVQAVGGAIIGQAVKESVKEIRNARHNVPSRRVDSGGIAGFLVWFVVLFGVGFVANLFAPARMKLVQDEIRRSPLKSGLLGFLMALALLPLSILLMITLIGIPLAILVLWPAALLAYAVGFTAVASEIGMKLPLFRGRKTQALVLAMGLLLLVLVGHIPVVGPLITILLGMVGFGAIIATRFGRGAAPPPGVTSSDLPTGVPV